MATQPPPLPGSKKSDVKVSDAMKVFAGLLIICLLVISLVLVISPSSWRRTFKTEMPKVETNVDEASEAQAAKIRSVLGNDYPVSRVLSIKSTTHERAYYVGAEFNAEGVGNVVGIWLMGGSKEEPNLVLSVDGVAHQFSRLGKASDSKAGGSIADPEAKALTDALKQ